MKANFCVRNNSSNNIVSMVPDTDPENPNYLSWQGYLKQYDPDGLLGLQPVRVLHGITITFFKNSTPHFQAALNKAIEAGKIHPELDIKFGPLPIKPPSFNRISKKISLGETFLSYLWCTTFAWYTIYSCELTDREIIEQKLTDCIHHDKSVVELAEETFEYATSLIVSYSRWDISYLPNPERYHIKYKNFVEQTNMIYSEAVKFMLLHEFIHATFHSDFIASGYDRDFDHLFYERDADKLALLLLTQSHIPYGSRNLVAPCGVVATMLSMFYFQNNTHGGKRHPDLDERLEISLRNLGLDDDSSYYRMAMVGLNLWAKQFRLPYKWDTKLPGKEAMRDFFLQIRYGNK